MLVAEDDAPLREQLRAALTEAGYVVDVAGNGIDAAHLGAVEPLDAVVLDLGLPERDGLTVLREWRAAGIRIPVVVLTARGTWQERVLGIDAGADDYVAKPFEMEELIARLRAVLRRAAGHASTELVLGPLRLDTRRCKVSVDGRDVPLTPHEYRLLAYLIHHQDRVVSRSELTEHIYAQDQDRDSNTIDVFIARLRRKLGAEAIRTVRGLGFQAAVP
ncbi:MAG TPA: response regulator transcription factor [Steroidobacteraceae bacterium]|nr:response regulator transcription factor [Steroidobacteraceae bacterium]